MESFLVHVPLVDRASGQIKEIVSAIGWSVLKTVALIRFAHVQRVLWVSSLGTRTLVHIKDHANHVLEDIQQKLVRTTASLLIAQYTVQDILIAHVIPLISSPLHRSFGMIQGEFSQDHAKRVLQGTCRMEHLA